MKNNARRMKSSAWGDAEVIRWLSHSVCVCVVVRRAELRVSLGTDGHTHIHTQKPNTAGRKSVISAENTPREKHWSSGASRRSSGTRAANASTHRERVSLPFFCALRWIYTQTPETRAIRPHHRPRVTEASSAGSDAPMRTKASVRPPSPPPWASIRNEHLEERQAMGETHTHTHTQVSRMESGICSVRKQNQKHNGRLFNVQ